MKEKRILAMFITSVVTLVASLAVTFGVLTTLADPVVATGVVRYAFAFNESNSALIATEGKTLKIKDGIVFKPSDELRWNEYLTSTTPAEEETLDATEPLLPILVNCTEYDGELKYLDESISSRVKLIPIRVSNKSDKEALAHIKVTLDNATSNELLTYTKVRVYDFQSATPSFEEKSDFTQAIAANGYRDYVIVIYVDETDNFSATKVDYANDYLVVNVNVTNEAIEENS